MECVRPTDIAEIGIRDGDGGTNNQIQEIYIRSDDGRHVFFEANDGDGMHSVADGHLVAIQGTQVDIDDNDKDIHIHTDQSILSTVFPNVLK
ncbi:hypothetical protein FACS1894166_01190 [Bacilli bacterium]|nr:hypothetical protein FACS1894166_01190 [Bacilli bacterium]